MAIPGSSVHSIGDLVTLVINDLQQRTDVATLAPLYIALALKEITESYPFEELRKTGPNVVLTVGTAIYPVATFLNPTDDYTSPESFVIYVDPPANQSTYTLKYRTPIAIEPMIAPSTVGTPAYWSRYGTKIFLGPNPNLAFTMFMRYQVKHPMPDNYSDTVALTGQKLFIPDTWEEIVAYAAAERIALIKRWNDQRRELHEILYGDPEFIASEGKRGRPGLIAARLFQVERDQKFSARQLGIIQGRYSSR